MLVMDVEVRGGVVLTEEGVDLDEVWGLAEENKDWASKHDLYLYLCIIT